MKEKKGSEDQRESWRNYKQKPNGETDLAEQMVSEFLPEALHTHRIHYKEGEKDGETWWVETHLHFLSSNASEGRRKE